MQTEQLLSQLFDKQPLNQAQAETLFNAVLQGALSNEQLAAALIALKLRGETAEEISGAVNAVLANAQPF
ncbi:anthranilate phosphoribosyltransferase, partial [Avibacterium paragallinarum]